MADAYEGRLVLKKLVKQAGSRITILAGKGITKENKDEIIRVSGVTEIHGSRL
jgi:copper homeostasis protein